MEIKLFGDKVVVPGSMEGLASRIFKCSVVGANELKRTVEKSIPRPVWLSIVLEFVFFYIALANRHSSAHLPDEKQEKNTGELSDTLLTAIVDYVFEDGGDAANAARVNQFKAELEARMQEYGKFELMVRESQSEKSEGTALWAFCNQVTALAGKPKDLVCIMVTHAHIYDSTMAIGMEAPDVADWTP
jgi:hypothetical protein